MNLYGKKVILRPLEEEDTEMIRQLSNDPDFEKMVEGWSFPISKKDEKIWFQNYSNTSNMVRYIIETKEDGAVGMTGLKDIDWKNGTAVGGGIRIAKKQLRSKGIATDAWMTTLKYAFDELRLNRINATVISYNKASLRMLEKCGFKKEGLRRESVYKCGKFYDQYILGCLRSDYIELINKNNYWKTTNICSNGGGNS